MNLLIVSPFFPYPLSQGGRIRLFNIIKYLSRKNTITLASLVEKKSVELAPLNKYCDEILLTERKAALLKDLFLFLSGSMPFNSVRFSSQEFRSALRNQVKRKSYDLVHIEFSLMWQYANEFQNIPVALDMQNVEYDLIRQIKERTKNPLKHLLYILEEKKLKALEELACRQCRICLAVSEGERQLINSKSNPEKVFTVPNGVDPDRFSFEPRKISQNRILFIGGLDYSPNLDSAVFLLKDIFRLIEAENPDITLDIVGRGLSKIRPYAESKNVVLHENVPDILPFMRSADVLAVPLRYGAGTRIKILEAMAAGLPIVTTSKGCEGLEVEHRVHVMIADSPSDFARSVREVLENGGLRHSLVTNARKLIEDKYSWEQIAGQMEKHYLEILA